MENTFAIQRADAGFIYWKDLITKRYGLCETNEAEVSCNKGQNTVVEQRGHRAVVVGSKLGRSISVRLSVSPSRDRPHSVHYHHNVAGCLVL